MTVAEKVTYFRNKKGYSVNKLANIAGLSQGFVRQIELGEKNPTVESLALICEALDISLAEFFAEKSDKKYEEILKLFEKSISSLSQKQLELLIQVANEMIK